MADDAKTHGFSTDSFLWASDRESSPAGEERQLQCTADGELFVNVFASNTDATEDEATPATIVGTPMMMERDDALTTLAPTEGDWTAARSTAEGALWTQDFNSDALLADTNAMVVDLAVMEALLTTIDADTSIVAGAVSGTEMQVDVVTTAGLTDTELRATPVPVSGTVDLGATDNAVLDQIEVNTSYGAVVGGGAEAAALRVTLANDSTGVVSVDDNGGSLTVDGTVTTVPTTSGAATTTTPSVTTSTTTVLAANASRKGALITNPTGGTTCYINFGAAATTAHHELAAGGVLDVGIYTGAINGITASGTQDLAVTEFT